jgi:hypothetical protein
MVASLFDLFDLGRSLNLASFLSCLFSVKWLVALKKQQ